MYCNYGGSRKTTSSAYANIGGTRKQIYPYSASTVYQYRRYTVNSWTTKTISSVYGHTNFNVELDDYYKSYSFNSSTGNFSLSTVATNYEPSNDYDYEFTTTVYLKLANKAIAVLNAYGNQVQQCHNCGNFQSYMDSVIYAYPNGYSSSYSTVSYSSPITTGYGYNNTYTVYNCSDCGSPSNETAIPIYSGYYFVAI